MNSPSSRHLSHDFPAYKGLSLREMLFIVVLTTSTVCFIFLVVGYFIGWMAACGSIGFLLGFIVSLTLVPKPIAHIKAGKPHGYLMKKLRLKLALIGVGRTPYLSYRGIWQKSRRIGGNHV